MSRIGKQPISIPAGVKANIAGQLLKIEGPKGKLERIIRPEIKAALVDGELVFTRLSEDQSVRAYHGMERALASSMVEGVSTGFSKELALIGVGYRVDQKGDTLTFALGHSHTIDFELPKVVKGTIIRENRDTFVKLESPDKQLLGQVASKIRSLRPPEPYKGKGVRYRDEVVRTKVGKTGKK